MRQLRNLSIVLTLVSLAPLLVMAQQFTVPLTISDGVTTSTLYLGIAPGANLCINAGDSLNGVAEAFLPPAPPGGVFDARFVSPRTAQAATCYDQGSTVDLRPPGFFPTGRDSFRVKSQLGTGSAMVFTWPAGLSAYFTGLTLRYFDGSANVNVDMLANTTADVTLAGDPATVNIFSAGLVTPQPMFAVAPGSINFGNVGTSSTKTDSVTVSNPGAGPLSITAIGSSDPQFTVLPAAPQTVSAGSSMKFYITYAPAAIGPASGTITFTDNATVPPPPHTVAVSGTGQAAPPSFEFGLTVGDGTMRPTNTYTLHWGVFPGAHICVDASDTINGHGEAFLPPPPPGGVFDARFISPRTGGATCYDQGTSNDYRPFNAFGQLDTFKMKSQLGTGSVMLISWPNNLNTRYQSATLRFFDGSANQNIDMLTNFSADVTSAGDPATVTIFTTLKTPAPPDTNRQFGMAPTTIAFGTVGTCAPKMDSVTVTNVSGSNPLLITGISSTNARFSVTPSAPQSIGSGSSMKFYVTFAPTANGAQSGTITFANNGNLPPASTNVLSVSGTGSVCPPNFTVVPNPLNFGLIALNATKLDSVVVTNNSTTTTMDISAVNISDPAFSVNPATGSIPAGGNMKFYFTAGPVASTRCPVSATAQFVFTGPTGTPGTLSLSACFSNTEPQFVTVTPDSMTILSGFFFQRPALRTRAPRLSYPTWANLMQEVVVQGGFQPGSSESDVAGAMRIGKSFMRAITTPSGTFYTPMPIRSDTAWARITSWIPARGPHPALGTNWGALQGTLKSRVGFPPVIYTHDNYARGLDSTKNPGTPHRTLMRGQQTLLSPYYAKNKLFAELVALKFNIAANDLGKAGSSDSYGHFGNLVITLAGNPLNGLTVRGATARVDSFMTFERNIPDSTWFDDAYTCVAAINRAFVGALDTTYNPDPPFFKVGSFYRGGNLHINGVAGASATGGFLTLGAMRPNVMPPTNDLTEGEYGLDLSTGSDDPSTETPVELKLYQNYPNPFNPSTKINFTLAQPSQVSVKVYNILGQEVATLLDNEVVGDGYQTFVFDAHGMASGVYFYVVTGKDLASGTEIPHSVGKMLLVK